MKNKSILTFALFSILSVLVLVGIASAAVSLNNFPITAPANIAHNAGSFPISFTLTNAGTAGTVALTSAFTSGTATIALSSSSVAMADGTVTPTTAAITGTVTFDSYQSGNIVGTITAKEGAVVLATSTFTVPITSSSTFDFTASGPTLSVKNTGNAALSVNLTTSATGVTFSSNPVAPLAGLTSTSSITSTNPQTIFNIIATPTPSSAGIKTLTYSSFFPTGATSDSAKLSVNDISISSDGSDDIEWTPLDTITVDATVKNEGSTNSIKDVYVEIGLFNSAGENVISDVDFISSDDEKVKVGTIKHEKEADVKFEFRIPADFADESYKLALVTYGTEDVTSMKLYAQTSSDLENDLNNNLYQDVSVTRDEDNMIVVSDIVLSSSTASAGDVVKATFVVYNVGGDDEDQIRVNIASTALGISQSQEIRNFDFGDAGKKAELTFTVPAGLAAGKYTISFDTEYGYDSREDSYDDSSADSQSITLDVTAPAEAPSTALNVAVSAEIASDSEAKAGEQMVVVATIKNNEATAQTIVVDAKSFESWAELDSIVPSGRVVTINAGESKEVTFTFNVKDDAQGEQTFTIETIAGAKSETKEVAVTIDESASMLSGLKGNSMLWIIGAINLVLIVLIIVVAVRLSRK